MLPVKLEDIRARFEIELSVLIFRSSPNRTIIRDTGAVDSAAQDATAVDGSGATGTGEKDMYILELTDADEKLSQESTNGVHRSYCLAIRQTEHE